VGSGIYLFEDREYAERPLRGIAAELEKSFSSACKRCRFAGGGKGTSSHRDALATTGEEEE